MKREGSRLAAAGDGLKSVTQFDEERNVYYYTVKINFVKSYDHVRSRRVKAFGFLIQGQA